jgi:SAM-dependent methyltransferase
VESGSFDMVTALSVWTHFVEDDAVFYFREVARALRPGGKAILTFFLLDRTYRDGLSSRTAAPGRFHRTPQDRWIFDRPCDGSGEWLHPGWTKVPESAVGVTEAGLERLLADSGMERIEQHPGNWKEVPGAFFQDVLVFRKR